MTNSIYFTTDKIHHADGSIEPVVLAYTYPAGSVYSVQAYGKTKTEAYKELMIKLTPR